MSILNEISDFLQQGRSLKVKALVEQALAEGVEPNAILEQGLIAGMSVIGAKFKENEVFVPEVLIAARAMNVGIGTLKPYLSADENGARGRVVIGTVKGDLHDIGKNLVKLMIEGKGLEVIDLGVDVDAPEFIKAAIENKADVICLSALLTTTMNEMKSVIHEAEKSGIRDKVKIMIGGAPITQRFCDTIGADCYTDNAATAADAALAFCTAR